MSRNVSKTILYLRSDVTSQTVVAGGSVSHTLGIVRGFIRADHRVICGAAFMYDELKDESPAKLVRLSMPWLLRKVPWRVVALLSNAVFFLKMYPTFKQEKIDFIYQRYTLNNCLGVLLGWWFRIPVVLEYNGSEYWVDHNWAQGSWLKLSWLTLWIERYVLRASSHIVVVSDVLRNELADRRVSSTKILVTPNGVDTDVFDSKKLTQERARIRSVYGLEEAFIFGFVGTFSVWHGVETIAAMIPRVLKRCPRARFMLIGDGPLLDKLKDELTLHSVHEAVVFTGAVPQLEACRYLAACDAYLCPTKRNKDGSRFFGSPTKLFEYLSMGKPILASDLEQLSDILHPSERASGSEQPKLKNNESIAVLTDADDVDGFVNGAVALAESDEKFLAAMGRSAREAAVSDHGWRHRVRGILDFVDLERSKLS